MAGQKLLDAKGVYLVRGLTPSLPFKEGALWQTGKNIMFAEQSVQPTPGQGLLVGKPEVSPVRGMVELMVEKPTLYFATLNNVYRWKLEDPAVEHVAEVLGGQLHETKEHPATLWSMINFGRWVIAANGIAKPIMSKNTGDFYHMPEWPEGVKILGKIGPFVLGFGNTADPTEIVWSTDDNPEVVTITPENKAGYIQARNLGSGIMAAAPLGEGIAFYGTDAMHYVSMVGYPNWFGQQRLLSGVGVVGLNAVVSVGRVHYGFSHRGIFRTDGSSVDWNIDTPIHDYVYDNLNREQMSKVTAWHWKTQGMIAFFYPTKDSLDLSAGVALNYRNGAWTILGFTRTAVTDSSVFPFPIAGDAAGNLYRQDQEGTIPDADPASLDLEAAYWVQTGVGSFGVGQGGVGGWNGEG